MSRSQRSLAAVPAEHDSSTGNHADAARIRVESSPDAARKIRIALINGTLPDVYVNDGKLRHVEPVSGTAAQTLDDDAPLPVRAPELNGGRLAMLLADHTTLLMTGSNDGAKEWMPPIGVLTAVLSPTQWAGIDVLTGIIGMPVIRHDGTLLQTPGYDRKTGLYLAPTVDVEPIDEHPSPEAVADSRAFVLDKLLRDFDWRSRSDLANYLGLLVTPFLRRYLRCLTPLGIISATMPGSGKSILAGLVGLLAGQKTLPWAADNDAELEKTITSAFTIEAGVVVFDNLAEGTVIASPILANLLTNPMWSSRILGSTKIGTWPNERLWLVTGNNLRVGGDIGSRAVLVQLSPRAPHPEERTGFAIDGLDAWILDPKHRAKTLRHLMVMILGWMDAGHKPDNSVPNMRQFGTWARGVGGFLAHHGVSGFLTNVDELRATDEDDRRWAAFLATWLRRHGAKPMRAREIFADAQLDELDRQLLDPWDATFITTERGAPVRNPTQLGQMLTAQNERFHDGLRVVGERDNHAKVMMWHVEEYTGDERT